MKRYYLMFRDELGFIIGECNIMALTYYNAREFGLKYIREKNLKNVKLNIKHIK